MAWETPLPVLVTFYALRMLQTLVGVAGNVATLHVIPRMRKPRTNAHVLMWSLALADLVSFVAGREWCTQIP